LPGTRFASPPLSVRVVNAAAGLLSLVWLIGIDAMSSGIVMIPLALRLRHLSQEISHARA
jgi:hypothetical protein